MSDPAANALFEPFDLPRGHCMKNRIALAAMTNGQSKDDGCLGEDEHHWLKSRAAGGFGMVATCAAYVSDDGKGFEGQLGIANDAHLPGLTRLASTLKSAETVSIAQIFHGGVRAPSKLTGSQPWSASEFELKFKGFEPPRAATEDDIANVIDAFAGAAARAASAGFDGVEIHGAHGYLLTQFLGTNSNTREDQWGGNLENRARLIRDVLKAARAATPSSFLIGVRVSPEISSQGLDLDDSVRVAKWLADDGADFIHVSNWDSFAAPTKYPDSQTPLTQYFRDAIGSDTVVMATGGIWTRDNAEAVIGHGADLVGLGRAAIANAEWPRSAAAPDWQPTRPPLDASTLRASGISETFVTYLRRFENLVAP